MTEEIKEILDNLGNKDKYIEEFGYQYKRISLYDSFQLLDYITNLQQKLQMANGTLDTHNELIEKLYQENERLKEENILLKASEPMSKIAEDYGYKSRCEKAIEYIKMYKCDYYPYELTDSAIRNVINILNGSDDK